MVATGKILSWQLLASTYSHLFNSFSSLKGHYHELRMCKTAFSYGIKSAVLNFSNFPRFSPK